MTVEAIKNHSKFLGLHTERKVRVLEFRGWTKRISDYMTVGGSPDVEILQMAPIFAEERKPTDRFVFLHPESEDEISVKTTPDLLDEGETVIYSREQINDANLTTIDGAVIRWRKTQQGDYVPLEPDQILHPIQLRLGLVR